MTTINYDVFVSYSSKDKKGVHALARRLKNEGLRVWLDSWVIKPGDVIPIMIRKGIEQSRTLLMCMSTSYFESEWGELESQAIVFSNPNNSERRLIPLLIEKCDLPATIAPLAYINLINNSDKGYKSLLIACQPDKVDQSQITINQKAVNSRFLDFKDHKEFNELTLWCYQKIKDDQFLEGEPKGAWSKRNYEYVEFLYGDEGIPEGKTYRESITISSIIAKALFTYSTKSLKGNNGVNLSLRLLYEYLLRQRYETDKKCGFGLTVRELKSEKISVSFNHTIRAVSALLEFQNRSQELENILRKTGMYIKGIIEDGELKNQKSIGLSSFHYLLCLKDAHSILPFSQEKIKSYKKKIEILLNRQYQKEYLSWDIDQNSYERESIDNALYVLSDVNMSLCNDNDLLASLIDAVENLNQLLIDVDEECCALPFYQNGVADLGATIQFLWILLKNETILKPEISVIRRLFNFILMAKDHEEYITNQAYPWFLSSIFLIYSHINIKNNI